MFYLWMDIGYCSLLIRDGFKRASGKPVRLEASTPRSRGIYAHLGFEVGRHFVLGENVTLTLVVLPVVQRTSVWCRIGRRDGCEGQRRCRGGIPSLRHDKGALGRYVEGA